MARVIFRAQPSRCSAAPPPPLFPFFLSVVFWLSGRPAVYKSGACLEIRWLGAEFPASSDTDFLHVAVCKQFTHGDSKEENVEPGRELCVQSADFKACTGLNTQRVRLMTQQKTTKKNKGNNGGGGAAEQRRGWHGRYPGNKHRTNEAKKEALVAVATYFVK